MVKGVGLGFRPRLAGALLRDPARVDFLEVVAEACRDREVRREVVALSRVWPVVLHGVSLSLGSAEGLDRARVDWFAELARELRAPLVSEHIAFVRAGGIEIGHLTELPQTRDAVKAVARNVSELRRRLPDVPLLLENPARSFVWESHEMSEGDFLREVLEATGCPLLLDVANLHANALNGQSITLRDVPLDRVGLVHVAGGRVQDGFYVDTHADPVPEAVFELAAAVPGPVLLERDHGFDDPAAILAEVDRLRTGRDAASPPMRLAARAEAGAGLADAQRAMAALLTNDAPAPRLAQARAILQRKHKHHAPALRSLAVEHGPWERVSRLLRSALRGRDAPGSSRDAAPRSAARAAGGAARS